MGSRDASRAPELPSRRQTGDNSIVRALLLVVALLAAGCAVLPGADAPAAVQQPGDGTRGPAPVAAQCSLPPVTAPTPPAEVPGYTQLDPATGLHVTGEMVELDLRDYRLTITGKVDNPLSFTYDTLRCLPKTEARLELVCPGFFVDTATWAGAPLAEVLALAGTQPGASVLKLVSADSFVTAVDLDRALAAGAFLAYEWEGQPLPILHGFPVRAVFPGEDGGIWTKWLVQIEVD